MGSSVNPPPENYQIQRETRGLKLNGLNSAYRG